MSNFEEFEYSQFSVPNALFTTSAPASLTTAGHQVDLYGVPLAGVVDNNDHGLTVGLTFLEQEINQLANTIGIIH